MISNISSITGGECDELNATETSRYTDFSNSYIDPYWHQFPKVSREAHYFMGSVLLIIGLVGMAGNGLVIWIFTRCDISVK